MIKITKLRSQIIKDLKSAPNATARNKVIDSYIAKIPELKEVILPVLRRADFFVFYTVPTTVQEDVQLTYFVPQLTEKDSGSDRSDQLAVIERSGCDGYQ